MIEQRHMDIVASIAGRDERIATMEARLEGLRAQLAGNAAFREDCRVKAWHEDGLRPGHDTIPDGWPPGSLPDSFIAQEITAGLEEEG
jgi:hypothetical protein